MIAHYQHFTVLSQALHVCILTIARNHPDIRSRTINAHLKIILNSDNSVTISWTNQIIRREGIARPRGRPDKDYYKKEEQYFTVVKQVYEMVVDKIGIPLFQDVLYHFGVTNLFLSILLEVQKTIPDNIFRQYKKETLLKCIETQTTLALDPSVDNIEEAMNANISHTSMSPEFSGTIIKKLEKSENLPAVAGEQFQNFWMEFLKHFNKRRYFYLYGDGHTKPYYSKETHMCGVISNSGQILPGTKYVLVTTTYGFIVALLVIRVDEHYQDAIYEMAKELNLKQNKLIFLILDREGCGVKFNEKLNEDIKAVVLTPLRCNQYKGIKDFRTKKIKKNMYAGEWRDKKKRADDKMKFLIICYPDRICVFAVTGKFKNIKGMQKEYKKRWPYNEGAIKDLIQVTGFNSNVCNGVDEIDNPKTIRESEEAQKKIEHFETKKQNYKEQIKKSCASKIVILKRQKKNAQNRINQWKEKLKNCIVNKVKVRKTNPDYFVGLQKSSIVNLLRYILMICLPKMKNAAIEKMYQMLMNRNGKIIETKSEKIYLLKKAERQRDKKILIEFVNNFNKLGIEDENRKKVILRISNGET